MYSFVSDDFFLIIMFGMFITIVCGVVIYFPGFFIFYYLNVLPLFKNICSSVDVIWVVCSLKFENYLNSNIAAVKILNQCFFGKHVYAFLLSI